MNPDSILPQLLTTNHPWLTSGVAQSELTRLTSSLSGLVLVAKEMIEPHFPYTNWDEVSVYATGGVLVGNGMDPVTISFHVPYAAGKSYETRVAPEKMVEPFNQYVVSTGDMFKTPYAHRVLEIVTAGVHLVGPDLSFAEVTADCNQVALGLLAPSWYAVSRHILPNVQRINQGTLMNALPNIIGALLIPSVLEGKYHPNYEQQILLIAEQGDRFAPLAKMLGDLMQRRGGYDAEVIQTLLPAALSEVRMIVEGSGVQWATYSFVRQF